MVVLGFPEPFLALSGFLEPFVVFGDVDQLLEKGGYYRGLRLGFWGFCQLQFASDGNFLSPAPPILRL
jgi:hypothetical protein